MSFQTKRGANSRSNSPVIKGYTTSHGTPVINIHLESTPRQRFNRFEPLVSPTYSDLSLSDEDESPVLTPIKSESLRLYTPPVDVASIPLIPIVTPQSQHKRHFSAPRLERRSSNTLPTIREDATLSGWITDAQRWLINTLTKSRPVRRIQTLLLMAGVMVLIVCIISVVFTSTSNAMVGSFVHGARVRSRLDGVADRHAAVGADMPNVHFAGERAHMGRKEKAATKQDEVIIRDEEHREGDAGFHAVHRAEPVGVPRRASAYSPDAGAARNPSSDEARHRNANAASDEVHRRLGLTGNKAGGLAGGLAYPGLLQARKAAAEAFKVALEKPGASDMARSEGQKAINEAENRVLPLLPTHLPRKTVFEVTGEAVMEPKLSELDLADTPEREEQLQRWEEMMSQQKAHQAARKKGIPLRLARFKKEGLAGEMHKAEIQAAE